MLSPILTSFQITLKDSIIGSLKKSMVRVSISSDEKSEIQLNKLITVMI